MEKHNGAPSSTVQLRSEGWENACRDGGYSRYPSPGEPGHSGQCSTAIAQTSNLGGIKPTVADIAVALRTIS
jgi:hypothetical protein